MAEPARDLFVAIISCVVFVLGVCCLLCFFALWRSLFADMIMCCVCYVDVVVLCVMCLLRKLPGLVGRAMRKARVFELTSLALGSSAQQQLLVHSCLLRSISGVEGVC